MRLLFILILTSFLSIQTKAQQVSSIDSPSSSEKSVSLTTQKQFDSDRPYPVNFSHFGVTVPDLDEALTFYKEVFGWYLVAGPIKVTEAGDNPLSKIGREIYGEGWETFRFVHLASADGIGFEIFEFAHNNQERSVDSPFKTGFHHVSVQSPNVSDLVQRIKEHGGKQTTKLFQLSPGKDGYKMVFTEDPFGNVIEIYSHSYAVQNKDLGK